MQQFPQAHVSKSNLYSASPYFSKNTSIPISVFSPNAGKYRPKKNSVFGHFSRSEHEHNVNYYCSPSGLTQGHTLSNSVEYCFKPVCFLLVKKLEVDIINHVTTGKTPPGSYHQLPGRRKLQIPPPKATFFWKSVSPLSREESMRAPVGFVIGSVSRFHCYKSYELSKSFLNFCISFRVYCENILRLWICFVLIIRLWTSLTLSTFSTKKIIT